MKTKNLREEIKKIFLTIKVIPEPDTRAHWEKIFKVTKGKYGGLNAMLIDVLLQLFQDWAFECVGEDEKSIKAKVIDAGYSFENAEKRWDGEASYYLGLLEGRNQTKREIRENIKASLTQ